MIHPTGANERTGSRTMVAPVFSFGQAVPTGNVGACRHVKIFVNRIADATVNTNDAAEHVEQRATRVAADQCAIRAHRARTEADDAAKTDHERTMWLVGARKTERE